LGSGFIRIPYQIVRIKSRFVAVKMWTGLNLVHAWSWMARCASRQIGRKSNALRFDPSVRHLFDGTLDVLIETIWISKPQ
jgi:hypothetical protein